MAHKYLTTTLPYVNADPHIGHALEFVQADALARYWRLIGHEVFFNTGTDEHGQKIAGKADEKGQTRQEYVDHFAARFKESIQRLNLSYDAFVRTTDEQHKKAAQEMWRKCDANGDIYKKRYSGLYCIGCESFKKESDLVDGKCPDHLKEPEHIEEENYFFRLSKYQDFLREYLSDEARTLPDWRRKELLAFVESGLEDLSISREKTRLDWGIPVPGDDEHVMYVWFDALTNYISTLGWPEDAGGTFKRFWLDGETLQLAGKDQVRFQSLIWQAMLKSAGIKGTDKIVYHGFIISGGQKMSKTIGNVISPFDLLDKYGTEATRYLLLRHIHPFEDTDVTWERLDEWYNAGLVNGLGNLTARILKMSETHLGAFEEAGEYHLTSEDMEEFNYQGAMDRIWGRIQVLDEKIALTEPFKLVKTEPEKAKQIIDELRTELMIIGKMLEPFMPETSHLIQEAVSTNKKPENLFPRIA